MPRCIKILTFAVSCVSLSCIICESHLHYQVKHEKQVKLSLRSLGSASIQPRKTHLEVNVPPLVRTSCTSCCNKWVIHTVHSQACQSCQTCHPCRVVPSLSVVLSSSSQCRLTEAHACARLERRVGRVLRTLVGGHSITSISSALSLSRRFHRTFEQGTGTFHLVAQAASSLTSAIFPHARYHATV